MWALMTPSLEIPAASITRITAYPATEVLWLFENMISTSTPPRVLKSHLFEPNGHSLHHKCVLTAQAPSSTAATDHLV